MTNRNRDDLRPEEAAAGAGPVERHPLAPFLPPRARVLLLGSFPPPRRRWCMEFYYPNPQNDMWRIAGLLFFGDKGYFLDPSLRGFDRDRIVSFCRERGIALHDTAAEVVRLRDNASDDLLHVVRESDLGALLRQLPECRAVAATGGKAADTLVRRLGCDSPAVGGAVRFSLDGRPMSLWRMPSTSRAYPRPIEWKAEHYGRLFAACGLL